MITHNVPADLLTPGGYSQIDIESSTQGLIVLSNAVVLIGIMGGGGTATPNVEYQITDEALADTLFEKGRELALMCRTALQHAARKGQHVPLYAIGIADPAGTAAIRKITVTAGTAAADGTVAFSVGDVKLTAGVKVGDDQDAVALAIVNAVTAVTATTPVTATVNGVGANIADLTHNWTGVTGNDLLVTVDDVGKTGLTITPTAPTPGVGAATIAGALAGILAKKRHIIGIANHAAADVTAADAHLDLAWAAAEKGWRFIMMAETGSIATAAALAQNDERQLQIISENNPSPPSLLASMCAVDVAGRLQPNYNYDDSELPLSGTPADASLFSSTELETALAAGLTPLRPNAQGKMTITRLVTTRITDSVGNPFSAVRDYSTINTVVYMAKQADILFSGPKYSGKNKSKRVLKRMRSDLYALHLDAEELEYIEGVEALASQLKVISDPDVQGRSVTNQPVKPVENLHQRVTKTVLHNRIINN